MDWGIKCFFSLVGVKGLSFPKERLVPSKIPGMLSVC